MMIDKEKLEEAKRLYQTANADQRYVLESLFPELAESEDEKIRKDIIALLHFGLEDGSAVAPGRKTTKEQAIAWLEKQALKPKWTEEDEDNLNMAIYFMRSENTLYSPTDVEPVVEWLCGLKQRIEK